MATSANFQPEVGQVKDDGGDAARPFWRPIPRLEEDSRESILEQREGSSSSKLVVVFSGVGEEPPPKFELKRTMRDLRNESTAVLFLRDLDILWFVPRCEWFASIITDTCAQTKAKELCFIGISAGGFAALFFRKHFFPSARVLALSPQAFLSAAERERVGDKRWEPYINHLNRISRPGLLDLADDFTLLDQKPEGVEEGHVQVLYNVHDFL